MARISARAKVVFPAPRLARKAQTVSGFQGQRHIFGKPGRRFQISQVEDQWSFRHPASLGRIACLR
jgi:hypothetical protein